MHFFLILMFFVMKDRLIQTFQLKTAFVLNIDINCYERLVIQPLQLKTVFVLNINMPCYERVLVQALQIKTTFIFSKSINNILFP